MITLVLADAGHLGAEPGVPLVPTAGTAVFSVAAVILLAAVLWLGGWLLFAALRDRRAGVNATEPEPPAEG